MEDDLDENKENGTDSAKKWLQDNLRIIVSVVIVVVIAGGIYSYSKRSETPAETADIKTSDLEQFMEEEDFIESEEIKTEDSEKEEIAEEETAEIEEVEVEEEQVTSVATSKETEKSFIESAQKGEGVTHLARRALSDYLEKSADSELTAEHKIYIEDYLRKKVNFNESVFVGTTVEFSKDLVKEAIAESKKLNADQLNNLHKYAVLVPSLS